jgi:hypothetical protein
VDLHEVFCAVLAIDGGASLLASSRRQSKRFDFLKFLSNQDALATARFTCASQNLVFGKTDTVAAGDGKSVCRCL